MGKESRGATSGVVRVLQELLKTELYKRSQGRVVRQATCFAIWIAVFLATWRMHVYMQALLGTWPAWLAYVVPSVFLLVGLWLGYRIVNLPTFADFLIAVEAEMNKVSWPSRTELIRSSIVVIVLMFGLTIILFTYDTVLYWLLTHVLGITEG